MDTKELKSMLGNRAKDIIASGLNETIKRTGRNEFIRCPFHNDTEPSFSWFEEGNVFKCMVCQKTLDIYEYYQDFESMSFVDAKSKVAEELGIELTSGYTKKSFTAPTENCYKPLTKVAYQWFESRGITKQVADKWDLASMFIGQDEVIIFKHINERKKFVLETSRFINKKDFRRNTGNKTILFGMDRIDTNKPVIIVEGHIDAISVSAVYDNVLSVPSGISNKDWIENCSFFIDKVKNFIFWADNDGNTGISEADDIRKRIGIDKCVVDYHPKYKDANELLMKCGVEALSDFVDDLLAPRIEGLVNMGRLRSSDSATLKFETGFKDVDKHLKGFEYGALSVIFGRDNEGKSTYISQIITEILKTQQVFLYSGELSEYKVEEWVISQIAAENSDAYYKIIDEYGEEVELIKDEYRVAIKKWYQDRFWLYEDVINGKEKSQDRMFRIMESAYRTLGIKVFFIDNMMTAVDQSTDSTAQNESRMIDQLKRFAKTLGVHIFLIAHPNKQGSREYTPLNKVDVNGSKTITNTADYIIAVERSFDPEAKINGEPVDPMYRQFVEGRTDVYYTTIIRVLKNRVKAPRKDFFYRFHVKSTRFFNKETNKSFAGDWQKFLKCGETEELEVLPF